MPYIKKEFRQEIDQEIDNLAQQVKKLNEQKPEQTRDGLLNYAITRLLNNLYANANYHDFNEIIGMLECCQLEYYRKKIAPYEDQKEFDNGEVK